jgi:hypothetical protein
MKTPALRQMLPSAGGPETKSRNLKNPVEFSPRVGTDLSGAEGN